MTQENDPVHREPDAEPKKKKKKKHDDVDGDEAPKKKKKKKKKKPVDGEEKPSSLKKKKKKKHAKSEESGLNDEVTSSSIPDAKAEDTLNVTSLKDSFDTIDTQEAHAHRRKTKKKKKKKKVAEAGAEIDDEESHTTAPTLEDEQSVKKKKKKKKKTSPTSSPVSPKKKNAKKHKRKSHADEPAAGSDMATRKLPLHETKEKMSDSKEASKHVIKTDSGPQFLSTKPNDNVFEIKSSNFILESEKALASRPARKPRKKTISNDSEPNQAAAIERSEGVPSPNLTYNYSFSHGLSCGLRCGLPSGLPAGM